MFMLVVLPPIDALLASPTVADVELVLLLCANTESATTAETANATTIATMAIKFNLDMQILRNIYVYIILYFILNEKSLCLDSNYV